MSNDLILIVGGSSGLGHAAARVVAARTDTPLLVTATRAATAEDAARRIREASGNINVSGLALDLASPDSISDFAGLVRERLGRDGRLRAVAFNAGLQITGAMDTTEEGYERTIAVNHFGHVRLLAGLWPLLSRPARLVFTGSGTHSPEDPVARLFGFRGGRYESVDDWASGYGDPDRRPSMHGADRYANSKLANLMTVFALARRYPPSELEVFAIDPGMVPGTGLARQRSGAERLAWHTVMRWLAPVLPGASTMGRSGRMLATLLTDPAYAGRSGEYIDFAGRPARVSATASDDEACDRMLGETCRLLGLSLPEPPTKRPARRA